MFRVFDFYLVFKELTRFNDKSEELKLQVSEK